MTVLENTLHQQLVVAAEGAVRSASSSADIRSAVNEYLSVAASLEAQLFNVPDFNSKSDMPPQHGRSLVVDEDQEGARAIYIGEALQVDVSIKRQKPYGTYEVDIKLSNISDSAVLGWSVGAVLQDSTKRRQQLYFSVEKEAHFVLTAGQYRIWLVPLKPVHG